MNRYPDLVAGLIVAAILMLAGHLMSGCCWMAKRTCFPECPPTKVVTVEQLCKLPPTLKLPAVVRSECPDKDWVCYDRANAGRLALRLSSMKDWILETQKRCGGPKPPASQPTE